MTSLTLANARRPRRADKLSRPVQVLAMGGISVALWAAIILPLI